jgi:pilus assembly protein CpaC
MVRGLALALLAGCMIGPHVVWADGPDVAMTPGQAGRLTLVLGKSEFVDFETPFATVVVGNPAIADAVVMSQQRFYLLGHSIGTTNVQVLDAEGNVVAIYDLVVGADIEELDRALSSALPNAAITVHSVNGRIRLSGSVEDDLAMSRALEIAANFSSDPVINTLIVRDPKQVFLKVQIIEAVRTVGQELGLDISTVNLSIGGESVQNYAPMEQAASVTSAFTLDANLRALVDNGLARYLAAPTLSALSGETASFLAGGETPIPVSTQDSSSITFKEFGVRLNFTPQVMDGGLINLNLEAEVSQVDLSNSYTEGDNTVPGFSTRRAQTTVELRNGESFVIAGLLQSSEIRGSSQYPWLGDVPIPGAAVQDRHAERQRNRTSDHRDAKPDTAPARQRAHRDAVGRDGGDAGRGPVHRRSA